MSVKISNEATRCFNLLKSLDDQAMLKVSNVSIEHG